MIVMKYLKVVAAVIKQKDKILIARRKKGKHLELKWEYPGGKLEKYEDEIAALKRELKSEKREPETEPFFGPRVFVTTRDPFLRGLSFCLRFSPEPFNFSGRKSRILILRINLSERKRVKRERRRRIDKKTNFLVWIGTEIG